MAGSRIVRRRTDRFPGKEKRTRRPATVAFRLLHRDAGFGPKTVTSTTVAVPARLSRPLLDDFADFYRSVPMDMRAAGWMHGRAPADVAGLRPSDGESGVRPRRMRSPEDSSPAPSNGPKSRSWSGPASRLLMSRILLPGDRCRVATMSERPVSRLTVM